MQKSNSVKTGWSVRAVFEIHLHLKDKPLLEEIQTTLGGVGKITITDNKVSLKIYRSHIYIWGRRRVICLLYLVLKLGESYAILTNTALCIHNVNLTIYIVNETASLGEVVKLEQYLIDTLKPSLNVDLVASGSGYHGPMRQEIRDKLRKERGTLIYVYDIQDFSLLYLFESKQHMYDTINIHHKTLSNCLDTGDTYLYAFFFSLDLLEDSDKLNLLNLEEIKELVSNKRDLYKVKHPAAKSILAEFKDDSSKNLEFPSLNSLANHLKGDRQVIREYLKGDKSGYYRGKWKFTHKV